MEHLKQSFKPLTGSEIEVLILGSIPGDKSIKLGEYYGNPQNRFWRMIATIYNCDMPTDYITKKQILFENKIALWDIAHKVNRKGSLDSAIRNEEPNDIIGFIKQNPKLRIIVFNGKKSEQLYNRYFEQLSHIRYIYLPSTSPANAACKFEKLCEIWNVIITGNLDKA